MEVNVAASEIQVGDFIKYYGDVKEIKEEDNKLCFVIIPQILVLKKRKTQRMLITKKN